MSPPELIPYLSHIVDHLAYVDRVFTSKMVTQLISCRDMTESKVTPDMRKVLLKWLMQVGRKFQVKDETI